MADSPKIKAEYKGDKGIPWRKKKKFEIKYKLFGSARSCTQRNEAWSYITHIKVRIKVIKSSVMKEQIMTTSFVTYNTVE